jgi:hypothetical protein
VLFVGVGLHISFSNMSVWKVIREKAKEVKSTESFNNKYYDFSLSCLRLSHRLTGYFCVPLQVRFTLDNSSTDTLWYIPVSYVTQEEMEDAANSDKRTLPRIWLKQESTITIANLTKPKSNKNWALFNIDATGTVLISFPIQCPYYPGWRTSPHPSLRGSLNQICICIYTFISDSDSLSRLSQES